MRFMNEMRKNYNLIPFKSQKRIKNDVQDDKMHDAEWSLSICT